MRVTPFDLNTIWLISGELAREALKPDVSLSACAECEAPGRDHETAEQPAGDCVRHWVPVPARGEKQESPKQQAANEPADVSATTHTGSRRTARASTCRKPS